MSAFRTTVRRVPSCVSQASPSCSFATSTPKMMLFPRVTEFSPFFRFMDEVERSFPNKGSFSHSRNFTPRVDISEEEQQYTILAEVPGIEQDNINIEWADANTLTVAGRTETRSEVTSPPKAVSESDAPASPSKKENQASVEETEDEDAPVIVPRVENDAESTIAPASEKSEQAPSNTAASEPKYWLSERSSGSFARSFKFSSRVDHDAVKASLKNGILSIIVPKAQPIQPRKINIE